MPPTNPSLRTFSEMPIVSSERAQLRQLLKSIFSSDSDFDAYMIDYYPEIHRWFSSSMERESKISLLLERTDPATLIENLRKHDPYLVSRFLNERNHSKNPQVAIEDNSSSETSMTDKKNNSAIQIFFAGILTGSVLTLSGILSFTTEYRMLGFGCLLGFFPALAVFVLTKGTNRKEIKSR